MKKSIWIALTATCVVCFGCPKNSVSPPLSLLGAYMIDGPWQMVSSGQYNSAGSVVSRTTGTAADSLIFAYAPDANANVIYTNILSYVGGSKASYSYSKKDSTIPITPVWKRGYGDTLFVINFSDQYLTLKIKKIGDANISYEIDSLKKIRFWY